MLVNKQLPLSIYFHIKKKSHTIWKSVATVNCLVTNILQNNVFCVQQKKETRTGLEELEGE